jgi:hypothetical protein
MFSSIRRSLAWRLNIFLVRFAIWLLKLSGWYVGYWNHWRTLHNYVERQGLHILPVHYYSPIPNSRELPTEIWSRHRFPTGFSLNIDSSLSLLEELSEKFRSEFRKLPHDDTISHGRYNFNNNAYTYGDAEVLYSIIRQTKPRRIVEIGSGFSTLLTAEAIRFNLTSSSTATCELVAIEPYPPSYLSPPPAELTRIESTPVQNIPIDFFSSLEANDILFIDSSHVVRIGGDVIYEYLEILPALKAGVLIHIHDIFLPFDYPRDWIESDCFFWNEQYLLEAFLTENAKFEVMMPTYALWALHADRFQNAIGVVPKKPPSSFWMRRL